MSIFGQRSLDRSVALPALQFKVTLEEVKVEPGAGLTICAGPVVGGARWETSLEGALSTPIVL